MGKNHRFNRTYVHLVFPTHEREPTIDHAAREQFAQIISGVAVNLGAETLACGGWTEHMHGLVTPPSTLSLSDFVGRLKGNSSRLANKNDIFEAE
ncbi:MAG: REP element-mobilizing transposase RayT, partial [Bradymonadia bacterium]